MFSMRFGPIFRPNEWHHAPLVVTPIFTGWASFVYEPFHDDSARWPRSPLLLSGQSSKVPLIWIKVRISMRSFRAMEHKHFDKGKSLSFSSLHEWRSHL